VLRAEEECWWVREINLSLVSLSEKRVLSL